MTPAESAALGGILEALDDTQLLDLLLRFDRAGRRSLEAARDDALAYELIELAGAVRWELTLLLR